MELVGELYIDSQRQWIERGIKSWDTLLSVNGLREKRLKLLVLPKINPNAVLQEKRGNVL